LYHISVDYYFHHPPYRAPKPGTGIVSPKTLITKVRLESHCDNAVERPSITRGWARMSRHVNPKTKIEYLRCRLRYTSRYCRPAGLVTANTFIVLDELPTVVLHFKDVFTSANDASYHFSLSFCRQSESKYLPNIVNN